MLQFFMAMNPPTVTAQEREVTVAHGKPRFYDTPAIMDARQKLASHLARHAPEAPITGAIRLTVRWCFPAGKHEDGSYRVTKPDTDNLSKLLKDCMTAVGFWVDDAQVASELTEKFWAETPGIFVRVEAIS